jgi:hypothetical protein
MWDKQKDDGTGIAPNCSNYRSLESLPCPLIVKEKESSSKYGFPKDLIPVSCSDLSQNQGITHSSGNKLRNDYLE